MQDEMKLSDCDIIYATKQLGDSERCVWNGGNGATRPTGEVMISNPDKSGRCLFDFGGVSYEIEGGRGTMSVPECLTNALYDSMMNGVRVGIELDDDGESTILAEGHEGSWFIARDHHDTALANGGRELTRIFDRRLEDVAEELVLDLEKCSEKWEEAFGLERGLVVSCVEMLRHAQAVMREREAKYERLMAEAYRKKKQVEKQNKKSNDVYQSYLDWEETEHGKRMISRSEAIDWENRDFIIGFPGNGWNVFKLGTFEFTFSDCGGCSPAGLLDLFKDRVSKRKRLVFCLNGEGPEFWFVETTRSRYGIVVGMEGVSDQVIDFSAFSLEQMARQLVIDASLDVYGFCVNSCGGCSLDCEQWFRSKVGMLKRAINRRWPKKNNGHTDDEWDMLPRSFLRVASRPTRPNPKSSPTSSSCMRR